jgi:hypothetical protein
MTAPPATAAVAAAAPIAAPGPAAPASADPPTVITPPAAEETTASDDGPLSGISLLDPDASVADVSGAGFLGFDVDGGGDVAFSVVSISRSNLSVVWVVR